MPVREWTEASGGGEQLFAFAGEVWKHAPRAGAPNGACQPLAGYRTFRTTFFPRADSKTNDARQHALLRPDPPGDERRGKNGGDCGTGRSAGGKRSRSG